MNKKTILALAAFVAAGSALATVTSGNTLCRIALTVTTKQVMIGLPLVDVGGDSTVEVTNFVLTDGLEEGTTLEYKDGTEATGGWHGWVITGGKWVKAESEESEPTKSLARGKAVLLTRPDGYTGEKTIYLYGQVASGNVGSLSQGYNLLGNPGTTAMTSLDGFAFTPAEGDCLLIPTVVGSNQVLLSRIYKNGGWDRSFSIPAGQGFWYYKKGSN